MRKWMRERMKRRKKDTKQESATPAPAPLQPAYFDAEVTPREETAREPEPLMESPPQAEPVAASEAGAHPGSTPAPRRRRRRRGGRGRGAGRTGEAAPATAPLIPRPPETPAPPAREAESRDREARPAAPVTHAPKGTVVLAIGLPGSGKSSWFKRHNITPLSSDLLRALLFDDPTEQRYQDLIFSNLRSMLKARLIARRPMNYVDATNLTPHERQSWIKLAKDFGYEVQAVFFDVPAEVCLERNQRRDRVVPEEIMRRMAAKLRPPTFEEGFAKITVVRVKHKA